MDYAIHVGAWSPGRCQEILDRAFELPLEPGTVRVGDQFGVDESIRKSGVRWFRDSARNQDLFDDLWRYIRRTNATLWGLGVDFLGDVQFTEYDAEVEGYYAWHEDDHGRIDAPYARKISVTVQLSDPADYDGGEFEMNVTHVPDPAAAKARGTVLVFRSSLKHRVLKVTRGRRYSLVAWAQGPTAK